MRTPAPPIACVVSFIDAINAGAVERLASLMSEDHRLHVLDEAPLDGRDANVEAWRGYATVYPAYVIYPHRIAAEGPEVAVLGHTTGSHLGLADDEEERLTVIWRARVVEGQVAVWQILEDTPDHRRDLGLDEV